jgi:hypothetical protein
LFGDALLDHLVRDGPRGHGELAPGPQGRRGRCHFCHFPFTDCRTGWRGLSTVPRTGVFIPRRKEQASVEIGTFLTN